MYKDFNIIIFIKYFGYDYCINNKMKLKEKLAKSKNFFLWLWSHLFPEASINVPLKKKKEILSNDPIIPHIPYKRSYPETEHTEQVPSKKKKYSKIQKPTDFQQEKPEKSTQTLPIPQKQAKTYPKLSESQLPSSKLRQKFLKILPSEPDPEKFSKIYEKYFSSMCFKLISEKSSSSVSKNQEIIQEKYSPENLSNVSDSFITPEESPILAASPPPKVSMFNLESPITHNIITPSIEG